jgi:hypothetical protein
MNRLLSVLWVLGVACGGTPGGDLGDGNGLGGDEWDIDVSMGSPNGDKEEAAPALGETDSCDGSIPSLTADVVDEDIVVTHTGIPSRWCRTMAVHVEQTDEHEITATYEPSGNDCEAEGCTITLIYTLTSAPSGTWTLLALDESVVVEVP